VLGRATTGDDGVPSRSIQWSMCSIQKSGTCSATGPKDLIIRARHNDYGFHDNISLDFICFVKVTVDKAFINGDPYTGIQGSEIILPAYRL
jgi:hypothetical protein